MWSNSMLTNVSLDKKLLEEVIALDIAEDPEHLLVDAIVECIQRKKELDSQVDDCSDLIAAALSSLGFWDNEIDDAIWNEV